MSIVVHTSVYTTTQRCSHISCTHTHSLSVTHTHTRRKEERQEGREGGKKEERRKGRRGEEGKKETVKNMMMLKRVLCMNNEALMY